MNENQEIPKGWVIVKTALIGNLLRGISYKKNEAINVPKADYLPILRANNIYGELNFNDLVYVPKKYIEDNQIIKVGDIVFAMSSGSKHLVGKSAVAKSDFDGSYGAFCSLLRINGTVNKKYIAYIFKGNAYRKLISEIAKGTNINNLKREHILDFEIPLPPLSEQQRIVAKIEELFSSLDKGIESLKTAQQQLKVYRQAVLKWAFEGKLTINTHGHFDKLSDHGTVTSGADYLPVATSTGSVTSPVAEPVEATDKEGDLPQGDALSLPKGWKWVTFNDVCIKIGDIDHKMPKQVEVDGLPYLSTKDFSDDLKIKFENAKRISRQDYLSLSKKIKPEKGDIIFPRYGTIGKNVLVDFDKEFLVSYSCAIIKLNHNVVDVKYAYYYSLSSIVHDEIKKYTVETTQANIGIASIKRFVFPLPRTIEEQQRIVAEIESRLSVCDKIEESIEQSLGESESLRQSILKKAFEGKLVPQDPSDLPAPRPGKWFVYVLECDDGSYYKGHTKDILERWKQHTRGVGAEWTAKHPPRKLVHWEEFSSEHAAVEREKDLKTGFGQKWLAREIKAGRTRQAGEPAIVLLGRIKAEREKDNPQIHTFKTKARGRK